MIGGFDEETLRSHIPEGRLFRHGSPVTTLERFMQESREAKTPQYCDETPGHSIVSVVGADIELDGAMLATIGIAIPSGELETNKDRFIEELKFTVDKRQQETLK